MTGIIDGEKNILEQATRYHRKQFLEMHLRKPLESLFFFFFRWNNTRIVEMVTWQEVRIEAHQEWLSSAVSPCTTWRRTLNTERKTQILKRYSEVIVTSEVKTNKTEKKQKHDEALRVIFKQQ